MARTPIYHEEKKAIILKAALVTFSTYGYQGTTNKLIAQEAGKLMGQEGKPVSPALIYHYFPQGKGELFAACMQQFPPIQQFGKAIMENTEQPPAIFLRVVAKAYDQVLSTEGVLPIIRLILSEGALQPELPKALLGILAPNLMVPMLTYFEKYIKAGKTRIKKPDQIVMQLLAPIFMRRAMVSIFPAEQLPMKLSGDEEFLDNLAQTLVRGIFVENNEIT
jgi:AcrR family transcriptional regulator